MIGIRGHRSSEIRIGISSCLLGEEVRYDGGHKHDRFLTGTVGRLVTFVPLCPEVEIGMSTPRESIRLERKEKGGPILLLGDKSGTDYAERMRSWSRDAADQIPDMGLSGYILKKNSPSCGMERVKIYDHNGVPSPNGRGLFAEELMERHPLLPVEEEGRLHDPGLRENFFERVFAYRRLLDLFGEDWDTGDLVAFHTREKFLLLAHEPEAYEELGRMVAEAKQMPWEELVRAYPERFMTALKRQASPGRHRNVLEHMAGFFKEELAAAEKQELLQTIRDYSEGLVPLVVPLTLVKHYVRTLEVDYLADQSYLQPHPKELMLRNHV